VSLTPGAVTLREMTVGDVADVVAVQEPASIAGLSEVFPQERYPFPRDAVARRWCEEIEDPGTDCYVIAVGDDVIGFAAVRGAELLHFGIAVDHWGSGAAKEAHDLVLDVIRGRGFGRAWLRVFTGNGRGRRFYEKLGWRATGDRSHSSFPPYAELLRYEISLAGSASAGSPSAGRPTDGRPTPERGTSDRRMNR
jgi:RimJ/RimL family protein N-acetyltransferase